MTCRTWRTRKSTVVGVGGQGLVIVGGRGGGGGRGSGRGGVGGRGVLGERGRGGQMLSQCVSLYTQLIKMARAQH